MAIPTHPYKEEKSNVRPTHGSLKMPWGCHGLEHCTRFEPCTEGCGCGGETPISRSIHQRHVGLPQEEKPYPASGWGGRGCVSQRGGVAKPFYQHAPIGVTLESSLATTVAIRFSNRHTRSSSCLWANSRTKAATAGEINGSCPSLRCI